MEAIWVKPIKKINKSACCNFQKSQKLNFESAPHSSIYTKPKKT